MIKRILLVLSLIFALAAGVYFFKFRQDHTPLATPVLTDPFLQLPTEDSIRVVWFTTKKGLEHKVVYEKNMNHEVEAKTEKLDCFYEDKESRIHEVPEGLTQRVIWRHEAHIKKLKAGERVPYKVVNVFKENEVYESDVFTLEPAPQAGRPLNILLTSDHQNGLMVPANMQKVVETIGQPDAVFIAGDMPNHAFKASEWFDQKTGSGFFACMQGRTQIFNPSADYEGGAIAQYCPIYPCIGNHDVTLVPLTQGENPLFKFGYPTWALEDWYRDRHVPANKEAMAAWVEQHAAHTKNYESIFTLPEESPLGKKTYGVQVGDVYLISLYITRSWRLYGEAYEYVNTKYMEAPNVLPFKNLWSYGDFIHEPFSKGSPQYEWLEKELNSEAFKQSKYKVVMLHQMSRGFGSGGAPAMVNPEQRIERDDAGNLLGVRYEYRLDDDIIRNDIEPLLQKHGVQLVLFGHSHLWQRFHDRGMYFLETSNVGSTHGVYLDGAKDRFGLPTDERYHDLDNYIATGDPFGAEPIEPTHQVPMVFPGGTPMAGQPMPVVSSDKLTVFSILNTEKGSVQSYYFDTTKPQSEVVLFDEFSIEN